MNSDDSQLDMPSSTEAIVAIVAVLVALPPSILVFTNVMRRVFHTPRYAHHSPGRYQYDTSHSTIPTQLPQKRSRTYYTTHAFQTSWFHPRSRIEVYSRPQRTVPVTSASKSLFMDKEPTPWPPPVYQPPRPHNTYLPCWAGSTTMTVRARPFLSKLKMTRTSSLAIE